MRASSIQQFASAVAVVVGTSNMTPCHAQTTAKPSDAARTVRAYVTNFGGDGISVIDPARGELVASIKTGAKPHGVAIAPDGKTVYVSNEGDGTLCFIDPEKKAVVDRIALGQLKFAAEGKDAHGLAVTPDGRELWISTQTGDDVTILNVSDHKTVGRVSVGRDPNWLGFTPDGQRAVVSNTGSNEVSIIDAKNRRVVATVKVGPAPKRLAVGYVSVDK